MTATNTDPFKQDLTSDQGDEHKYIVFKLGSEVYGTPLLAVREVVEVLAIKALPNTIPAFKGVFNLRGQIVGVLDLHVRFGLDQDGENRPVLLVFDLEAGALAAQVDQIISVDVIAPNQIEHKANIISTVPTQYIRGIAMTKKHMITLIDLQSLLSADELTQLNSSRILARVA